MTSKQMFDACVAIAPDFKLTVEFTTMPSSPRVLVWKARKPAETVSRGAGIPFPENTEFEPKFFFFLQCALATLSQP